MIKVGQCESCETWFLSKNLRPAMATHLLLPHRKAQEEFGANIPGVKPSPSTVYFCNECYDMIVSEQTGKPGVEGVEGSVQAQHTEKKGVDNGIQGS